MVFTGYYLDFALWTLYAVCSLPAEIHGFKGFGPLDLHWMLTGPEPDTMESGLKLSDTLYGRPCFGTSSSIRAFTL